MGIPSTYGSQLEPETLQQLNALAAQVQAEKVAALAGGSGGGGGGRRRSGSGRSSASGSALSSKDLKAAQSFQKKLAKDDDQAYDRALFYSTKGYSDDQVVDMLIDYGYTDKAVAEAMNQLRPAKKKSTKEKTDKK